MEQRRAIKKQIKYSPLQKLLFAVVLFVFAFSMFRVASVIAAEETFSIAEAKITSKSETVEVKSFTFEGCKITKTITYHKVGDNVVYAVTIMNNDSKDYVIKSISDDNENEYLSYEYDSYEGTKIESKGKFVFVVTEKYAKEVEDINSRIQSFSVNFKFTLEDEEGNESEIVIPSVTPSQKPKTGDEIGPYMVSAVLALIVMLILASKKGTVKVSVKTPKAKEEKIKVARIEKHSAKHAGKGFKVLSMLLILALLIPTVSKAVSSQALMLTFENVIELKDKLSISYEIDGEEHEITVDYGDTIGEIEVPEKEGYGFDGWEDEDGNPFDPETTPITDDITITPKYTAINYTITYNELTDDEKAGYETSYNIESNTINISDPVRYGYTFTGWSGTGLTGEDNKNISIPTGSTGDKVFEAHFAKETYTIILDLEGGEGTTEVTREYKDPIGELPEPEREGYNFSGWTDDEGNEVTENTEVTGPMEIHANWSAIDYSVTYNGLTDDEKAGYETSYNIESNTINISDPVREGYTFTGWSGTGLTGEDNKNISIPTGSTGDKVFEAHFTPIEYRISYTDVPDDEMAYYQYPTSYTIEDYFYYYNPHRNGYSFAGWSGTGIEGTTYFFEILEGSTGDKEITANWTAAEYTIKYHGLTVDEEAALSNPNKYTIEDRVELVNPENRVDSDGDVTEVFIGWYDGTSTSLNVVIPVGTWEEKEYTAMWQAVAPDEYIITYDLVLDQVVVDNPSTYTKLSDTITLNEPTREGYEFTGWSGTGLIGEANKTVIIPQGSKGDRSYTAHWKKNTYTITFEPTYGSLEGDPTMRRDYEDTLGTLPVPTREGYKFKGWYGKEYPNLPVYENTVVTGDMTLDASWEEISYTMYFYSNIPGDGQYYEAHLQYTQEISLYDYVMSRDGYSQTKWTTNADGTGTEYNIMSSGSGYSSVDGDRINLYAQWQGNQYTIEYRYNYDMSHHIFIGPSGTSNYTPEECPLSISNATATGFTFDGWSTSEYGTFNTDYELPEGTWGNQTLYGHFTPINYHITYDYDGGEIPNGGSNTDTYTVEDTIYLIEPEKTGHTFQGWSVVGHDDTGWVDYINGNLYAEDITVKAHYSVNSYTISFDSCGGNGIASKTVSYGSPLGELETPRRSGYTFNGWYSNNDPTTPVTSETLCQGDDILYANWTIIEYTVSYDGLDDYHGPELNNPTYYNVESETLYINNPQDIYDNDGDLYMQFSGWLVNGSISYYAYEEIIPHGSTGDITFTATWREVDPPTYYITYETHGFPTSPTSNPTFFNKKTETFTLSNPIGTGYIFDGWTGSNGDIPQTTVQVVKGTRQDLYFEAHMRPITYSIVFDANGGEGEQISETYTYHENGFLPQNPYTKEGYTFKEWNEAADGKSWGYEPGSNVLDKTSVDGEVITYYAIWTPNNYTITFDENADGVTGNVYDQYATYDETITLRKSNLEKTGYKFAGWNTAPDGTGTHYDDEAEVTNLATSGVVTLYAEWAVTPYTITFDKNNENATGSMESMSVPYGEKVNLNPLGFTYTDHKLAEWNTKADGTGTGYADEEEVMNLDIDGEVTLYAQWREIESVFDTGVNVQSKFNTISNGLSNITALRKYTGTPDISSFTEDNIVSSRTSPDPIYAWMDNGTLYYWSEDTHPAMNANAQNMFMGLTEATVIEVADIDTSNTWNMHQLFYNCNKVTEHDLSTWTFANVTDMYSMFYANSAATDIIIGSNDEETKITNLQGTWRGCSSLENLTFGVKIDKVNNMNYTFNGCGLSEIDFTNWDTSNVTRMDETFRGSANLSNIIFGDNFTTENVTTMSNMFRQCPSLTELDLTSFSSESLTNVTEMFRDSNGITSITFGPNFKMENVGSMYFMFSGCRSLTELDLSMCDTDNLKSMNGTFCQCTSLTNINFGENFNTSQVTNMNKLFERCGNLTELDLSTFDTKNVTDMREMFTYCGGLKSFIGTIDLSSATNTSYMFYNCQSIKDVDLSAGKLENITTMAEMFSYCYSLETLEFNKDTSTDSLTNVFAMFRGCKELTELDFTMFDTSKVTTMDVWFNGCTKLRTIYATDKITTDLVENTDTLFLGCGNIVGGMGTQFTSEHQNKDYAHIDGGESNPGYFTDKSKLNIIYYPNGDAVTGTMTNQTVQANTDVQLNANQYVNTGYAYGGWNTKPDGSGTHYDEGQIVNSRGLLQLYAQWGLTPYTVIFDKNAEDATGEMSNLSKGYGVHFNLPANQYFRAGYVFKGWNSKADGTGRHYDDEQAVINLDIDGEVTLYAEWFEIAATFDQGPYVKEKIAYLISETADDAELSIRKSPTAPVNIDEMTNRNIVSAPNSNFPIYMWLDGDILYWWSEDGNPSLNANSRETFAGLGKVKSIDTEDFRANKAVDMRNLFSGCGASYLDLSNWNTSNATNMNNMFTGAQIESINLGGEFTTENVQYMSQIFYNCNKLQSIDLSNFDTRKVTQMDSFFHNCSNLESIEFGDNFNTCSVTRMDRMFQECKKLQSIDLTTFNTDELTNMYCMFYGCSSLDSIDFGENFTAEKVTTMELTFNGCASLTTLDLSTFNTPSLKNMSSTFTSCTNLESIDFGDNFNTQNVTTMYFTFYKCGKLENLDLSKFDSTSLTNTTVMFQDCISLKSVTFGPNFKASAVTNFSQMFQNCRSLTELDLSMFEPTAAINLTAMFRQCPNLESIDFGDKFYVRNAVTMNEMFNGCGSLKELDLSSFNPVSATTMASMFAYCVSLESIDLGDNFDTSNVTNFSSMFGVCRKLTDIKFGDAFTAKNATSTYAMFDHCDIIEELDLGDIFETNNITNTYAMFQNCPKLTTIYVTGFDTSHIENSSNMFYPDGRLVGGMGTTYNIAHIDASYACIDGGESNPGYFTDKNSLNILFHSNDTNATGTMTNQFVQANTDTQLNENQYVYLGYAFGGWNTKADLSGTHYDDKAIVNGYGKLDLYAEWGLTPYTVVFDKNADDATGSMANESMEYGVHYNLPENTYVRNGFLFLGWNTAADGSGTHYDDEQDVINLDIDGTVTLYAEWEEKMAIFDIGKNVNAKMKNLTEENANFVYTTSNETIKAFKRYTGNPDLTNINYEDVSSSDSYYPIYVWWDETEQTIYYWTEPSKTYLNENTSYLFYNFSGATEIDLANIDTSHVNNMSYLFSGCMAAENLDVSGFETSNVTTFQSLFGRCYALKSVDVTGFDTRNATTMYAMFNECHALQTVDVTEFDTRNVTAMDHMFKGCNALESLDVTRFETGNVKSMYCMFSGCYLVPELDVTGFDTRNVTDMGSMFSDCRALTSLDVTHFNTTNVTRMSSMFSNCRAVTELDITNFDTSKVTDFSGMFGNCRALTEIDLTHMNTSRSTNFSQMFANCYELTSIDISPLDTSKAKDISGMFSNCTGLTSIDVSTMDTRNVQSMGSLFSGCTGLTSLDLSTFKTSKVTTIANLVNGCKNLESIDFTGWETPNLTNMNSTFYGCTKLESIDITHFNTSKVTNMSSLFNGCKALTEIDVSHFNTSQVKYMPSMFKDCIGLTTLNITNFDTTNVTQMDSMFEGCTGLTSIDLSHMDTPNVLTMTYMFSGCTGLTSIDVSRFDTEKVTDMLGMFANCTGLTSLNISTFNTANCERMSNMFDGCKNLTSINMSGLNTSKCTRFTSMFNGCKSLTSLDVSSFNTSVAYRYTGMFQGCSGLTELDISSFNTSAGQYFDSMFSGCTGLTKIYVSNGFTIANAVSTSSILGSCTSIVGGQGTTYQGSGSATYAHIDGGVDDPGYFTDIADKPTVGQSNTNSTNSVNPNNSLNLLNPMNNTLNINNVVNDDLNTADEVYDDNENIDNNENVDSSDTVGGDENTSNLEENEETDNNSDTDNTDDTENQLED